MGRWYSEGNSEFLGEAEGFLEGLAEMDRFLKPAFTVGTEIDIGSGAVGAVTPLRYHTNTRRFLVVGGTGGRVSVKMTPWKKHRRYLHEVRDYDRGEYRSGVDLWCPGERHRRDAKKVEVLEFDVTSGYVLYIPPYWGYTIRYDVGGTWVAEYRYCTLFNRVAFLGELGRTWLQQRNTYTKVHRRWVGGSGVGGSGGETGDGEKSSSSSSQDVTGDKKEGEKIETETSGGGDGVETGGRDGGEAWGDGLELDTAIHIMSPVSGQEFVERGGGGVRGGPESVDDLWGLFVHLVVVLGEELFFLLGVGPLDGGGEGGGEGLVPLVLLETVRPDGGAGRVIQPLVSEVLGGGGRGFQGPEGHLHQETLGGLGGAG